MPPVFPLLITLVPVAPLYVNNIVWLPVTVNPVTSEKFHTVILLPITAMLPLPIVKARVAVPVDETIPAVKLLLLRSNVPFVNVTVREDSKVSASCNCQVPPTPLNVIGKFTVTPLVVTVLVPDVEANVIPKVVDVVVILELRYKFPYKIMLEHVKTPAPNPVKSRSRTLPLIETVSEPAVTSIFRVFAATPDPGLTDLVPVDPLYVRAMFGVPV